jgi:hypothetical protein
MANTKITNPELFNLGDSTSATQLPVMTTTQRIAMNTVPILTVDYLVVAGGGGGSSGYGGSPQGGGGAGGLRTSYGLISGGGATAETSLSLTGGTVYALEVGAGGAGAPAQVDGNIGGSGGVSSFDAISTVGGGGSRSYLSSTPSGDGGSGGGQAYSQNGGPGAGTINQGYAGGSVTALGPGAGGGGAGSAGSWAASPTFGIGGDGVNVDITGSTVGYAGGGGRQVGTPRGGGGISFAAGNGPGGDGLPNTGGGGGGGRGNAGGEGGDGGSGVVVLRYPTADVASYTATGLTPTETTDGTDTILSFTTVGTGTITFTSSTPTGTISTGEMIFNSDTDKVEYWDGTKWYGITYEVTGESPYNNVLYTGSGDTTNGQSITGIGFKPDLVWFKSTGTTYNNVLYDSIRGTNAAISTNLSTGIYSNYNRLQSFDNDGFTIKANNTADLWKIDRSGQPFVAWCFKAGGAPVTNTDGNITVNVSANPNAGFSIVTGNVGSGAKTFGTGLNQAPELVIGIPLVASTGGWAVWFKDWTTYQYAQINTSAARITAGADLWNLSNWNTSGLMGVTSSLWGTNSNFVHYCFHSVDGYSKVGSYVGNGSTTGPIVDLGFEPAWLMFKCVTQSGNWIIIDNKRATSNPRTPHLRANSSAQNDTGANEYVDFTSNGFQPKGVSNYNNNSNNQTYIYMAFV